jgi:hypothetical protein
MRNGSYETLSVEQVVEKLPEARDYLREARIDRTSRMTLREAATAVSVVTDELLAQIEARMRRQARRTAEHVAAPDVAEDELMFA